MVTLRHAIKINAPRDRIFRALTDLKEMAAWHVGAVEGTIAPGGEWHLLLKQGQCLEHLTFLGGDAVG